MEAREVLEKVKNNEISIEEAEKCIQEEIYEKMGGWDEVVATCIGHTHIDVAWLWTIDQVRQKSCRSFATALSKKDTRKCTRKSARESKKDAGSRKAACGLRQTAT